MKLRKCYSNEKQIQATADGFCQCANVDMCQEFILSCLRLSEFKSHRWRAGAEIKSTRRICWDYCAYSIQGARYFNAITINHMPREHQIHTFRSLADTRTDPKHTHLIIALSIMEEEATRRTSLAKQFNCNEPINKLKLH